MIFLCLSYCCCCCSLHIFISSQPENSVLPLSLRSHTPLVFCHTISSVSPRSHKNSSRESRTEFCGYFSVYMLVGDLVLFFSGFYTIRSTKIIQYSLIYRQVNLFLVCVSAHNRYLAVEPRFFLQNQKKRKKVRRASQPLPC